MSALLVIIFVSVGEANHPATRGTARAARELLGADHEVQVREIDRVPDDARAAAIAADLHAAAVIELAWDQPTHQQVQIRFHVEPRPGFSDRFIRFADTDDLAERGRTVGYAIASTVAGPREQLQPAVPPPEIPPSAPADRRGFVAMGKVGVPADRERSPRGAIDVTASSALGVGGPAGGWGGALSGRWYVTPAFALRTAVSARSGQVSPAQATSLFLHAAAGAVWFPLTTTSKRPFELGARLDALLLREQLTHFDSDDVAVTAMRWLPGGDLALEGSWFFSASAGLLAAFGAEFAFGQTDVTIHQQVVTTLPPVRLVFQAGVRAVF
ncbi:MAG: hypothetical protein ABW133_07565 [Polyangiaceae bacterium]